MARAIRIEGTVFRDSRNREVTLHGINLAGDNKLPRRPDQPSHEPKNFLQGDDVSFVDRPFTREEAPEHFVRLRQWGYNTIRYIFTWEALEHAGPGKYDEDFISFTIDILRIAKQHGFLVFMDPHQDVWSRFTGGSGAPLWTIYACGLNPEKFSATEAALVQNLWPEPKSFPKMIWATNYMRLACQTIFTFFFAGKQFAPKAIINGINIEDFLQAHFVGACKHLATRVQEAGDLDGLCIIGWESVNEPNRGLLGAQDISTVPSDQKLHKGTSPTPWQAILTGSGRAQKETTWEFGQLGPYKSGSQMVDPQGQSVWLQDRSIDEKYGFKRGPDWKLGECVWAQHGVWSLDQDKLLRKDYFARDPTTGEEITYEYFTNHYFMSYYKRYRDAIRFVFPQTIMFCQPPVLEIPPSIKDTDEDDQNMVYAPHWYDGVTLMNKSWNRWWNVDIFGVLRGRYWSPALAIAVGETGIRNCFRDQLSAIRKEGLDYMGLHPCMFTEFGIPYDMDDGKAYKDGDYSSQIDAMDANYFGMEGAKVSHSLWTYVVTNTHEWGDQWNGEDLSIMSQDDPLPPLSGADEASSSRSESRVSGTSGVPPSASDSKRTMSASVKAEASSPELAEKKPLPGSARAARAFIRPMPVVVHGSIVNSGFTLRQQTYKLEVLAVKAAPADAPTEVFLPELHFPGEESMTIEVTSGKTKLTAENVGESGRRQILKWWNGDGQSGLTVKRIGSAGGSVVEEARGPCGDRTCQMM